MKMRRIGISVTMVFLVGVFISPVGATDLTGTLDGAPYKIRVPDNWNRTLLVYAHGYRDRADHPGETDNHQADAAPGGELGEAFLLAQGYAIAGSAYKNNGWAIEEGIDDTRALTRFFRDRFGKPERTILWGFSFGSLSLFVVSRNFPISMMVRFLPVALGQAPRGLSTEVLTSRSRTMSLLVGLTLGGASVTCETISTLKQRLLPFLSLR